ncbi:MAG: hypothetical protein ACI4I9_02755 [Porcipelethomonas sp.]
MDIMDEIEETIREKKSRWNYTPMREKDETEMLIDQLLMEYSSSSGINHDREAPKKTAAPVKPPDPIPVRRSMDEKEERMEFERHQAYTDMPEKTMIYSRNEINAAEEKAYESDEYDDIYDEEYYEEYPDQDENNVFDEFMDSEDDFDSFNSKFSFKNVIKTVFKIIVIAVVAGFCITGILTTINNVMDRVNFGSQTGVASSGSSKLSDEMKKVIRPAVAVDIDDFDSRENLSSEAMINTAVWEVIVNADISVFKDDETGDIIIPESQMKYIIEKLFGEGTAYENTTCGINDTVILYDKSKNEYIISDDINDCLYTPEVIDVSQAETDTYSVLAEYRSTADSNPVKRKMFTVKKTAEYYNIISAKTVS